MGWKVGGVLDLDQVISEVGGVDGEGVGKLLEEALQVLRITLARCRFRHLGVRPHGAVIGPFIC